MMELWLPISDIAAEGKSFTFDDQELWREGWREFKLPIRPGRDLVAECTIYPQSGNGALLRGTLKGAVNIACDRCTEPYEFDIDVEYETFEQIPDGEDEGEPRVRMENGQLQLDMGAILWEEFAVALPYRPLCSEECLGLCPGCGVDLNKGECTCEREEGDERLAVFRNLKLK